MKTRRFPRNRRVVGSRDADALRYVYGPSGGAATLEMTPSRFSISLTGRACTAIFALPVSTGEMSWQT